MNQIISGMDMILKFANIVLISYGFYKFLGKPRSAIEERLAKAEARIEEIERRQDRADNKISTATEAAEVALRSLLALIEFEISFCISHNEGISADLQKAKNDLHEYLAHGGGSAWKS